MAAIVVLPFLMLEWTLGFCSEYSFSMSCTKNRCRDQAGAELPCNSKDACAGQEARLPFIIGPDSYSSRSARSIVSSVTWKPE
jgi:hypothetical protein